MPKSTPAKVTTGAAPGSGAHKAKSIKNMGETKKAAEAAAAPRLAETAMNSLWLQAGGPIMREDTVAELTELVDAVYATVAGKAAVHVYANKRVTVKLEDVKAAVTECTGLVPIGFDGALNERKGKAGERERLAQPPFGASRKLEAYTTLAMTPGSAVRNVTYAQERFDVFPLRGSVATNAFKSAVAAAAQRINYEIGSVVLGDLSVRQDATAFMRAAAFHIVVEILRAATLVASDLNQPELTPQALWSVLADHSRFAEIGRAMYVPALQARLREAQTKNRVPQLSSELKHWIRANRAEVARVEQESDSDK
jgi:histone H3/H4